MLHVPTYVVCQLKLHLKGYVTDKSNVTCLQHYLKCDSAQLLWDVTCRTLCLMWQATDISGCDRYVAHVASTYCTFAVTDDGYIRCDVYCTIRLLWQATDIFDVIYIVLYVCCDRQRIYIGCDRYVSPVTSTYCTLAVTGNGYTWCDTYCTIRLLWQATDISDVTDMLHLFHT